MFMRGMGRPLVKCFEVLGSGVPFRVRLGVPGG